MLLVATVLLSGCINQQNLPPGTHVWFDANAYSFTNSSIEIKKGQTTYLHVVNKDFKQTHTFVLEGFDVKETLYPGIEIVVKLEPTETGMHEFYCDVDGHKELGMRGQLRVVE